VREGPLLQQIHLQALGSHVRPDQEDDEFVIDHFVLLPRQGYGEAIPVPGEVAEFLGIRRCAFWG
jgi:hypothetical protein